MILWQAPPILEKMVAHNQLDFKQDPDNFLLSVTLKSRLETRLTSGQSYERDTLTIVGNVNSDIEFIDPCKQK